MKPVDRPRILAPGRTRKLPAGAADIHDSAGPNSSPFFHVDTLESLRAQCRMILPKGENPYLLNSSLSVWSLDSVSQNRESR